MDHSLRINVRKTAFLMAKVPHLGLGPARFFPDQSHFTSSPRLAAEDSFPTATPPHIQSTSSHQYQNYHQYQHHPLLSRDDNLTHSSLRRGLEARKSPKGQGGTKGSPQHCRATTMSHWCRPWYTRQYFSIIYCFLHISQVNPFLGRGTRDQIANIRWITENAREFQKNIYFRFIDCAKAFDCVDHKKLWKILQEMGIPDHLICLLRNMYTGRGGTVRTRHGTTDWFQTGKGVRQGCILSPCLFNLYAE